MSRDWWDTTPAPRRTQPIARIDWRTRTIPDLTVPEPEPPAPAQEPRRPWLRQAVLAAALVGAATCFVVDVVTMPTAPLANSVGAP